MTDIVERLKDAETATHALFNYIFQDAREEIERLRIEIEALRAEVIRIKEVEFPRKAQAVADAWKGKCERLEAKVAEMEKQRPAAWCATDETGTVVEALGMNQSRRFDTALYLSHGAQNVPKAVAYLDLGTGGYMDIGTDLTDEALAALPKGKHMLGIVGTYGVDGYSPAQPAPSVPDGWETDLLIVEHAMRMNNWDRNSNTSDDLKRSAYKIISKLLAAQEDKS